MPRLAANARAEDRGDKDISASVEALRAAGLLQAVLPGSLGGAGLGAGGAGAEASVRGLMRIAQANLSLARLFEGHVNAVQLVDRFAPETLRHEMAAAVRDGALLGVWGADGNTPLTLAGDRLAGGKRFASGLGVVSLAAVTVNSGPEVRLALAESDAPERQDPAVWSMLGMRASASGNYDFNGLPAERFRLFGAPGDYLTEPGFVSGVWRIAALQLGGTFGLIAAARDRLAAIDRLEAEAQITRLAAVLQRAYGAIGLVERAARIAEGQEGRADAERAVALSILARLETEEIGQTAIATVERAIGLAHFDSDSETGRIARDLATYMRQVARDAFQQRAGRIALAPGRDLLELWHG
ncbi:acyl-CoA dehydrogenase [Marinovum sp.]|uniref:acyl-CoA dehydrogenase n=1 Tax=Marinovum sp. TaxID=2024839 RepID=UPI002B276C8D|nr:acyl-CoA dehydrogenase [Marinovum sp.]